MTTAGLEVGLIKYSEWTWSWHVGLLHRGSYANRHHVSYSTTDLLPWQICNQCVSQTWYRLL